MLSLNLQGHETIGERSKRMTTQSLPVSLLTDTFKYCFSSLFMKVETKDDIAHPGDEEE